MKIFGLGIPEMLLVTFTLLIPIALIVGAVFLIRYLIRYNARVKAEAARAAQAEEKAREDVDRSIINDL